MCFCSNYFLLRRIFSERTLQNRAERDTDPRANCQFFLADFNSKCNREISLNFTSLTFCVNSTSVSLVVTCPATNGRTGFHRHSAGTWKRLNFLEVAKISVRACIYACVSLLRSRTLLHGTLLISYSQQKQHGGYANMRGWSKITKFTLRSQNFVW